MGLNTSRQAPQVLEHAQPPTVSLCTRNQAIDARRPGWLHCLIVTLSSSTTTGAPLKTKRMGQSTRGRRKENHTEQKWDLFSLSVWISPSPRRRRHGGIHPPDPPPSRKSSSSIHGFTRRGASASPTRSRRHLPRPALLRCHLLTSLRMPRGLRGAAAI